MLRSTNSFLLSVIIVVFSVSLLCVPVVEGVRCHDRRGATDCLVEEAKTPDFHKRECHYCPPEGLNNQFNLPSEMAHGVCRNKYSSDYTGHRNCYMATKTGWIEIGDDVKKVVPAVMPVAPVEVPEVRSFRGCWNYQTCVDCMLAVDGCKYCPAESLGTPYPSWAPQRRKFQGACVHATSTSFSARISKEATDQAAAVEGACKIQSDQVKITTDFTNAMKNQFYRDGWINPDHRPDLKEAILACSSYSTTTATTVAVKSAQGHIHDMGPMEPESDAFFATIFESFSRIVQKMLKLSTVSSKWFLKKFPEPKEPSLLETVKGLAVSLAVEIADDTIAPGIGMANDVKEHIMSYYYPKLKGLPKHDHYSLTQFGAKASTPIFKDVTYKDVWEAYNEVMNMLYKEVDDAGAKKIEFRNPKCVLLDMLDEYDKNPPGWWGPWSRFISRTSEGTTYKLVRFAALWVLALHTGGLSIPVVMAVNVAISYAEYKLLEKFDFHGEIDKKTRLRLIMSGMLFYESFVTGTMNKDDFYNDRLVEECESTRPVEPENKGRISKMKSKILEKVNPKGNDEPKPVPKEEQAYPKFEVFSTLEGGNRCDITDTSSCGKAYYCKREFNFLPANPEDWFDTQLKTKGYCAPILFTQVDVNHHCRLHSECNTGLCLYNTLFLQDNKKAPISKISANGKIFRPFVDLETDSVSLHQEDRETATTGSCKWPVNKASAKSSDPDCKEISDEHDYLSCNSNKGAPGKWGSSSLMTGTSSSFNPAALGVENAEELNKLFRKVDRERIHEHPLTDDTAKEAEEDLPYATIVEPKPLDPDGWMEALEDTFTSVTTVFNDAFVGMSSLIPSANFFGFSSPPTTEFEVEMQDLGKLATTLDPPNNGDVHNDDNVKPLPHGK